MGGIVGATSAKFVMMAAALMFQGTVDGHRVKMAIMPSAPHSLMTDRLAGQIQGRGSGGEIKIGMRAEYFYVVPPPVGHPMPDGAEIQFGQDVLNDHPIQIDFAHHQIEPLIKSEMKSARKHMASLMLRRSASGWIVPLDMGSGNQVDAVLDLASSGSVSVPMDFRSPSPIEARSGGVRFALERVTTTEDGKATFGLGAFAGHKIIFDLGHDRIWIDQAIAR